MAQTPRSQDPAEWDFGLVRHLPDGTLDTSFGQDGFVATDFGGDESFIEELLIDANGSITAVGWADQRGPTTGDFALARYDSSGALDPAFGNSGRVTTDFGGSGWGDWALAAAMDARGRILAIGPIEQASPLPTDTFGMARYHGVSTPSVAIETVLEDVVVDLVTPALVSEGEANSLQKKLQGAIQKADKQNFHVAINNLEAFIHELEAYVSSGRLTQAEAWPMIVSAQYAIAVLGGV